MSKNSRMRSGSMVVAICLLVIGLLSAYPAFAQQPNTIVFPYLLTRNWATGANYWGETGDSDYKQVQSNGNFSGVNRIWNENVLFYDLERSHYDIGGQITWWLTLYNPTDTNFTGSNRIRVKFYNGFGGQIDETTLWFNSTQALINTDSGPDRVWDNTNKQFLVSLNAQSTLLIHCWGCPNAFFNEPASSGNPINACQMVIIQPNGHPLIASIRNDSLQKYRIGNGLNELYNFSSSTYQDFFNTSPGIYMEDYISANQLLVLPWFRERRNKEDNLPPCWSCFFHVMNASSNSGEVIITVKGFDNTIIGSCTVNMEPWSRRSFVPSSFLPGTGNYTETFQGRIEVTQAQGSNAKPVCIANHVRYARNTNPNTSINGYRTRIPSLTTEPFQIMNLD